MLRRRTLHTLWSWVVFLCIGLILAACSREEPVYAPQYDRERAAQASPPNVYLFGVHPLHNPQLLFERYQPLVDYLNRHLQGAALRLEASRDYPSYDEKLFSGHFHFALPNPYQTIESTRHGYRIFAKMGDDSQFRGIILVRRDSGIHEVADLKGKAVSYPAPSALAATMLPQWYLHTHGLDVRRDIKNRYVGSQESSILNVYHGDVAAAATWPPPWQAMLQAHPELGQVLEVKWQTEPLVNNGLVVREDVPPAVAAQVRTLLTTLHEHAEGRAILARLPLSRFETADDATYEPVRQFLSRFEGAVRKPREPI